MDRKSLVTILLIMLVGAFAFMTLMHSAEAIDVKVISVSPVDHYVIVEQVVSVYGTINTTGGLYQVLFENQTVVEEHAVENSVNATFRVPRFPKGNHTVILKDVTANASAASWFFINPAQHIQARPPVTPRQLQEGDNVTIWVNVTGGEPDRTYRANVTVKLPNPVNTTYWTMVKLNTTSNGEGHNLTTVFPNSFDGSAHTNFTGTYTVAFNGTAATSTFGVGLTNYTQYHRNQYVDIRAVAYKPSENVTVKILFGTKTAQLENVTATTEGIVHTSWLVNSTASLGTYTLNITSISTSPTRKNPWDVQTFSVPGFGINITARNLAGEPVADVFVKVFEGNKTLLSMNTSSDGLVALKLEIGVHFCNASFKGKKVGERLLNVGGAASFNLTCGLTNLRILVANAAMLPIPETSIFLKPDNRTLTKSDINGTIREHSLLPEATKPYVLNVSRYGTSFNVTTLPTLLVNGTAVPWYNVTIICPTLRLEITVTRTNGQPINGVEVKIREQSGGLYNEGNADSEGKVIFNSTFGKYTVDVYDPLGTKLLETTADLFQNQNLSISCPLFGLNVTVQVVDYFGQPISSANVTLGWRDQIIRFGLTQSDGTATFADVTGGTYQIAVRLPSREKESVQGDFAIDEDTRTIPIKLDKYVIFAGFLAETSLLAVTLIIVATAAIILAIEVYRRKAKPKESKKLELE